MRNLILLLVILLIRSPISAQVRHSISGSVLTMKNDPIPDVTITLKGTGSRIKSDAEGRFALSVSAKQVDTATLVLTYIGYKTKELKLGLPVRNALRIQLEEEYTQLKEVLVSTGYENTTLEKATGSFALIDNKLLNRQVSMDIITRLDGIVPGVLFDKRLGGTQNFQIRGLSTLNTTIASPLIILDNFPYEGNINNINPNDIDKITFLKDAAASAIWGAKAGNGVVVITTKKAGYNQSFKLGLTSNLTVADKPDLFYAPQMSSSDFIDNEIFLFNQNVYNANLGNSTSRPVITPVVEILAKQRSGAISADEATRQIDAYRNRDIRDDYDKYLYRKAAQQQLALNATGGSRNMNYLLFLGYDNNLQSLKENRNDRITFRSLNNFRPLKGLEIQTGLTYTEGNSQTNNKGPITYLSSNTPIYPYARIADENGQPAVLEQNYRLSYVESAGDGKLLDWLYRPLEEIYQADNSTKTRDILFNTSARYEIIKGLNAELRYQYENQSGDTKNYQSDDLFYTRDLINRFTVISGQSLTYNVPLGGILDYSRSDLKSQSFRGQLNFNKALNDHHAFSLLSGAELRNAETTSSAGRVYGYDDELMTSGTVDLINRYPVFGGLASNSLIPNNQSFSGGVNRFVSVYANGSYSYKSRYILSGSARKDASNLFGTSTNNKWKPLWSAGGKWKVSEEAFYHWQALPELSVRGTYGHSGNVNNSTAALSTISYSSSPSPLGRLPYALIQNPPNPDLRWEDVGQFNLGLDFSTKGRIFSGSFEYYEKKSTDLISDVNSDRTTGFAVLSLNSATLKTRGFDLMLESKNIGGPLSWHTNLMLSMSKNKVTRYLYDQSMSVFVRGNTITPSEGYPANSIFSYQWAGLDPENGNPRGFDLDGNISSDYNLLLRPETPDEIVFHGSSLPEYFGAIRNTFFWKNLELSANITYRFKYYFRRNTIMYAGLLNANSAVGHGDYNKRWQQPGDEKTTSVPSLIYPASSNRDSFYAYSEATVEDGAHIRLQDVNLNYTLDKRIMKGLPFQNLKLQVYASNLGILWRANKAGLDPDYRSVPPSKTISIGLNANF